ncbi:MAG: hypothetical protein QF615_14240, partial [Planctomycetota bacterium]|nr:hypothetical protein [Planctomycetota bacterium]
MKPLPIILSAAALSLALAATFGADRLSVASGDDSASAGNWSEQEPQDLRAAPRSADEGPARTHSPRSADGPFSLAAGSAIEHRLNAVLTQSSAALEGVGSTVIQQQISGILRTEILAEEEGEVIISMAMPTPRVQITMNESPVDVPLGGQLKKALGEGVLLRKSRDGQPLGFAFGGETTTETRMILRGLLAALRVVVPADEGPSYRVLEEDAEGPVTMAYRRKASEVESGQARLTLQKRLLERSSVPSPAVSSRDERGAGSAQFAGGWLSALRWEALSKVVISDLDMSIEVGLLAVLDESGRGSCAAHAFDQLADSRTWSSVAGDEERVALTRDSRRQADRQLVGNATVDSLVAEILSILAAGGRDAPELFHARLRLALLLQLEDEALARVAELLLAGNLPEQAFTVIAGALGSAATGPAQLLLCELAGDAQLSGENRLGAVASMFQLTDPLPEVLAAARLLATDPAAPGDVANSSLLLMGALGQTAAGAALGPELMALESHATESGQLISWLEALGNLGQAVPLKTLEPYLESTDILLRDSAVHALRSSMSPLALDLLSAAA